MTKSMYKSIFAFVLMVGVLLTSVAPSALAQGNGRYRTNAHNARTVNYDDRDYDYQRDREYRRNRSRSADYESDRYYDEYDRDRSKKDGWKRTGVGAAIGAAGGGLMGGRKGALIGGVAGAVGGYIYHRNKEKNRRY
ncbi:MAG TPA: YMGG-like glycine zipper-containing protein [Blastocatellia bacterium]|nr:YMGG-like glycine zipper-containing protein [Blastocatellia bacterium]